MPISIVDADVYIDLNVIDLEDWADAEESKKQRILNTASRVLTTKFSDLIIPDNAVYEFANVLATATNDTNRLQMQGIESFSIVDVGSFKFNRVINDYAELIPQSALDLIAEENGLDGISTTGKTPLWTVV